MTVTVEQMLRITGARRPAKNTQAVCDAFNRHAHEHGFTNRKRIAAFLARVAVEMGPSFNNLEENLNYSAKALKKTWPSRFKDPAKVKECTRNPQKLAHHVYGGRLGNKGHPNAGWLYRGSGPGQITGRANFQAFAEASGIDVVSNPDLLRDPDTGMDAAMRMWKSVGNHERADADDIEGASKRWNGGTHGLRETKRYWNRALKLDLSVESPTGDRGSSRRDPEPKREDRPKTTDRTPAPPPKMDPPKTRPKGRFGRLGSRFSRLLGRKS